MPVTYFERKYDVRFSPCETSVRSHITTLNDIKEPSPKSAQVMHKFAEIRQETVKYENEDGTVVLAGPSGGVEAGVKMTKEKFCLVTKAELSLARGEKCFPMTDDYGLQVFADLNANTGIEIGTSGVEVNFQGFGLTLGVGNKWTINTPLGGFGFYWNGSGGGGGGFPPGGPQAKGFLLEVGQLIKN